jgi:CRP/FNR family transcriptional regulator, anaerobic regulatory protein
MEQAVNRIRVSRKFETSCDSCPLRALSTFRAFTPQELRFIRSFKVGEVRIPAGLTFLDEGLDSPNLYTVLSGWAIKYKLLDDERRQVINYALPGDFLGLQAAVFEKMQHSVEALTDVVLCVFSKKKIWELYESHPSLGFDISWLAAAEKSILAEYLVTVGQRRASERIAFLLLSLYQRARNVGLVRKGAVTFPFTQADIADTVGFSLVHTNKSLNRLRRSATFEWSGSNFVMRDEARLREIACVAAGPAIARPLI